MSDWIRNARHALRSLRRAPAISASVVLLTGLGVGSVVTVFTVADHLFLRALPYPEADRLVFIERGSYSDFRGVRDRARRLVESLLELDPLVRPIVARARDDPSPYFVDPHRIGRVLVRVSG